MSRAYKLEVRTTNTTEEQLNKVLVEEFGWTEAYINDTGFEGEGTLYGGTSEEEAHNDISEAIKKLNPKAKVLTRWTCLEELPHEEYGDNVE